MGLGTLMDRGYSGIGLKEAYRLGPSNICSFVAAQPVHTVGELHVQSVQCSPPVVLFNAVRMKMASRRPSLFACARRAKKSR